MISNREIGRLRVTYTNYWIICWSLPRYCLVVPPSLPCCLKKRTRTIKAFQIAPTHVETIFFSSITISSCRIVSPRRCCSCCVPQHIYVDQQHARSLREGERERAFAISTHHIIMMGTSVAFFRPTKFAVRGVRGLLASPQWTHQFKPIKGGFIK